MTKSQKFFSALGRFFKNFFTKNIILKIVVVLFSILLWGFVIAEENPKYTKRIFNVPIKIHNEEDVTKNGWIRVDRSASATDVDVLCEINKHGRLSASLIECYVDLSQVPKASSTEEDTLIYQADVKCSMTTSEYGVIEDYTVKQVAFTLVKSQTLNNQTVEIETIGELPDNLILEPLGTLTISSLTGRKDEISRIDRLKVTVDLSQITNPGITNLNDLQVMFYEKGSDEPFQLKTSDGQFYTVGVQVKTRAYMEFPIEAVVTPSTSFSERFVCRETVTGTGKVVVYADDFETLEAIETIKTEPIVPKLLSGEETRTVSLVVPDNATLKSGAGKVTVVLTVDDLIVTQEYEAPIRYTRTRDGVCLNGEERRTAQISVTATATAMQSFNPSLLEAVVYVENYLPRTVRLSVVAEYKGENNNAYELKVVDPADKLVTVVLVPEPTTGE